ncbi:MAG: SpoIID/LytB domain-containing protein [Ruminococcaceae bacterium]|nr:SpoIID/LytB domain-containing protein [Oscillospiraceae bacterium]
MKRKLTATLVFALFVALTPALALISPETSGEIPFAPPAATKSESIIVLDEANGQTLHLSEREYLIGAVLCEMPASYEPEALKAQAVAARSYALYVKALREAEPLPELQGAYFTVNTDVHMGYMTENDAKSVFGDKFSEYYGKVSSAVDEVASYALLYEGAPIAACYHAISPGRTEASENVFASAVSYLVPVDSGFDETAEGFLSTKAFTAGELQSLFEANVSGFKMTGEPETWFGSKLCSESGGVIESEICGRVFTGTEVRNLLGLRSAAWETVYADGLFVFTVKGYGHGVGMSQNGANELARLGMDFDEILRYYCIGAEVAVY